MKLKVILFLMISCFLFTTMVWANTEELLSLENKYVKIFVNNSDEETGRFAVDVTGGDPGRQDDNNKPLIYGHPKPWTSFTTIRLNGTNYVFGTTTNKRSGVGLPGGEIVEEPNIVNNQLIMKCKYGSVQVEQLLDITRSPSTGALDTARVKYIIRNSGSNPVEIGLRTLLDTMVGDNDGAPFRIGNKQITADYSCSSKECPDFWQAFDSLTKPAVIAQGTLKGGDVTTPDKLIFTNWGKAADNPWEIPVQSGNDFTRLGEDELDSSLAMYWYPRSLRPAEQFSIVIYYGLGGITFSPGKTFLGISAPAEVQYDITGSRNYTIVMYLEHRGEAKADNIKINLNLPKGLESVSGKTAITLSELMPGVTKQFSWEIKPNGLYQGDTNFQIKVTGEHLESNLVTRKIRIVGPPLLTSTIDIPTLKIAGTNWDPYPLEVSIRIINGGESAAYDLKATFVKDAGVSLVEGERAEKYLANLESKAETVVSWRLTPIGDVKTGRFKIIITGEGIKPLTITKELEIPQLSLKVSFSGPDTFQRGQVINLDLYAYNLQDSNEFSMNVKFDPKQLRLVYVSRGTFLVEDEGLAAQWVSGTIDNKTGRTTNIKGVRSMPFSGNEITLARLNFIVIGTGAGQIEVDSVKVANSGGNGLLIDVTPLKYKIEEGKK